MNASNAKNSWRLADSVTLCWQLEMDQGGNVHTTEISRYYKSGFFFFPLKSLLQHHDYLLRLYSYDLEIILELTPTKVKAMVFPVVMYGYESWTVKKAEC